MNISSPTDWSPDGEFVLFHSPQAATSQDVLALHLHDKTTTPVAQTRYDEYDGRFSPNGRWVAYISEESGCPEIYVQAFPLRGDKTAVSSGGGSDPRWRGDGNGLFYLDGARKLLSVAVRHDVGSISCGTAATAVPNARVANHRRVSGGSRSQPRRATFPDQHSTSGFPRYSGDGCRQLVVAGAARITAMSLPTGTRLGPYEIVGPLGAGGMGEVYRATDSRLNRTVAIKILSDESAADADRRERFEREAKAISALDHPNICALYDVGDHDGTYFLVMPCLEGQTLADRLTKGALHPRTGHQVRHRNRDRTRRGSSPRHHPSRFEARQHHADENRCEAARLRIGEIEENCRPTDLLWHDPAHG